MVRVRHFLAIQRSDGDPDREFDLGINIDEPLGFDKLKSSIKRNKDYHGMSVELTLSELEFTGLGKRIVQYGYERGLNYKVKYYFKTYAEDEEILLNDYNNHPIFGEVKLDSYRGTEQYVGLLDFSTYKEQYSEYCSVSCKLGEIGVKTDFNNKVDVEIDLKSKKTFNSKDFSEGDWTHETEIPSIPIVYKNYAEVKQKTETGQLTQPYKWLIIGLPVTFVPTEEVKYREYEFQHEFGGIFCKEYSEEQMHAGASANSDNLSDVGSLNFDAGVFFERGDEWDFGENSEIHVSGELHSQINYKIFNLMGDESCDVHYKFAIIEDDDYITPKAEFVETRSTTTGSMSFGTPENGLQFDFTTKAHKLRFVAIIRVWDVNKLDLPNYNVKIYTNGLGKIAMELKSYKTKYGRGVSGYFAHNALERIVEYNTDNKLQVKSDWYSSPKSVVFKHANTANDYPDCGGGAMKMITSGYDLRGIISKPFNLSFKTLIENLNAVDCIGWGHVKEWDEETEQMKDYIRVERWDWFYNDREIFNIESPNKMEKSVDQDKIFSVLKIGYKKGVDKKTISTADSPFGERSYSSNVSVISNEKNAVCSFIADYIAIELTMRNRGSIEDWQYDKEIFFLSVEAERGYTSSSKIYVRDVDTNKPNSGIRNANEVINAMLIPLRNSYRWSGYLFLCNLNGSKQFKCTSRTLGGAGLSALPFLEPQNAEQLADARYNMRLSQPERTKDNYFLDIGNIEANHADIPRKMLAEVWQIDGYPMSLEQYKAVAENPMGIVMVDGHPCWIKEFSYSFADGTADFKLTPKYIEL